MLQMEEFHEDNVKEGESLNELRELVSYQRDQI